MFCLLFAWAIYDYISKQNKELILLDEIKLNKCPDFFEIDKGPNGTSICNNIYNIGKNKSNFYLNNDKYKSQKGDLYKCEWARGQNIPWDGIDRLC